MKKILGLFLVVSWFGFSQSSKTYSDLHSAGVKGWENSSEFKKNDIEATPINSLKDKYLNKFVTPVYISKEFREYKYKNFYSDKRLKKSYKNKKRNGFRENSSSGTLSTLVFYDPNTNYEFLYNQIFRVIDIYPNKLAKHVASTDDTNYIFVLKNKNIGKLYYEYNSKFKNQIEIESLRTSQ